MCSGISNKYLIFSRIDKLSITRNRLSDWVQPCWRTRPLEASETVLAYFDFDRTVYVEDATKKYRKWWHKPGEERARDID